VSCEMEKRESNSRVNLCITVINQQANTKDEQGTSISDGQSGRKPTEYWKDDNLRYFLYKILFMGHSITSS